MWRGRHERERGGKKQGRGVRFVSVTKKGGTEKREREREKRSSVRESVARKSRQLRLKQF